MINNGILERPKVKAKVIAWLADGKTAAEVAALVTQEFKRPKPVSFQAVCAFRNRHAAEIAPVVAEVERQIIDYGITHKVNRMADAQLRRDLMVQVQQARAQGNTGMETGIMTRTYKALGSGESMQVVPEYRVDTAMLREWRENDDYVSEQLGQIEPPAKGGDTYNIDKAILVRYIEGPS